jgi:hypothetical protein
MKTIQFYAGRNRSDDVLHIETDGCIVNIRVGLHDSDGRLVTHISVIPDDESRGGDGYGYVWDTPDGPIGGRVVRRPHLGEPGNAARRYTLAELEAMPTLSQGHDADLKVDDGRTRVWLHRTGPEDGEPYPHTVTVETYDGNRWNMAERYGAE